MTQILNYKGRVWTCQSHHEKIEQMLIDGKDKEVTALVNILNPKKSRGICRECTRLYWDTQPMNR
jgi:hypothetical protein